MSDNLGPQFAPHEARILQQRSVWQGGNEHHVSDIVDRHAAPAPTLYRGVSVSSERNYFDPSSVTVGSRMHLPPSSFSEDHDTALEFAHADDGERPYKSTMLRLDGGHGVNMSSVSNMPWEREWLSKGQFEVTHVGSDPDNAIDHEIHLRPAP